MQALAIPLDGNPLEDSELSRLPGLPPIYGHLLVLQRRKGALPARIVETVPSSASLSS